jgi:tRNA (mo5U34)-methyltransferase
MGLCVDCVTQQPETHLMNADQIAAAIGGITWYHQIDLGSGIVTPGTDNTLARIAMIGLPADLRGKRVLDIGAWDGAFSFEAERRGAERVVAVDSFCWTGEGWGTRKGFECARRILRSRVEDRVVEVLDLSPDTVGVFDLVLFLGVLYHMKHPLLALERVASVCEDHLILWTQIDMADCDAPAAAFYPGTELNGDPTNWWGPNPPAVVGLLKTAGFRRADIVYTWLAPPVAPGRAPSRGNAIFHAWR